MIGLVLLAACGGKDAAPAASADTASTLPSVSVPAPARDSVRVDSSSAAAAGSGAITPAPAPSSGLRGKVVASGSENMNLTTLTVSSGPMVVLTGNLEPELRSLAGTTVVVSGPETMQNKRRMIDVKSYEVVDVNGERPVVGTLLANSRLLVASDTLTVVGEVKAPAGSKVWITGDRSGKQLKVRSYGVIR